jgi:hypothetical protein
MWHIIYAQDILSLSNIYEEIKTKKANEMEYEVINSKMFPFVSLDISLSMDEWMRPLDILQIMCY